MELPSIIPMVISPPEVIESRIKICKECDKTKDMSDSPLYFFVNALGETISDAPKLMCVECSCPIWTKVRWPKNTCPLNKWPE